MKRPFERIFEAKGRPLYQSADRACGERSRWRANWRSNGRKQAEAAGAPLLAGPADHHRSLRRPNVPDLVTAGLPSVGLRMPAHPMALALARSRGDSARRAQRQPLHGTFPHHGGTRPRGPGRCRRHDPRWRPVHGRDRKHRDFVGWARAANPAARHDFTDRDRSGDRPCGNGRGRGIARPASQALQSAHAGRAGRFAGIRARECGLDMPSGSRRICGTPLRLLHELDAQGFDWIAIELPPDTPEWAGVRDRLLSRRRITLVVS